MSMAGIQIQSIFEHKPGADIAGVAGLKASCLCWSSLKTHSQPNRTQGLPRDLL